MEAGYWHFMREVDKEYNGFENYVDKTMEKAKLWMKNTTNDDLQPSVPNPYHGSLYGKWLAEYLEVFDGSQFTVVTLEQYTKTPQKVASFISNRIKFKQQTVIDAPEHKHERAHPKMQEKIGSTLASVFEDDEKLFDELVRKHCM